MSDKQKRHLADPLLAELASARKVVEAARCYGGHDGPKVPLDYALAAYDATVMDYDKLIKALQQSPDADDRALGNAVLRHAYGLTKAAGRPGGIEQGRVAPPPAPEPPRDRGPER